MAITISLSAEQRDCLQKVSRATMTTASERLNQLMDTNIEVAEPHIEVMAPSDIAMALHSLDGSETISGVCQGFIGAGISGEAMLFFNDTSFSDLAHLLGHEGQLETQAERELLMDASNIIIGANLKGFAEQIEHHFSYCSPVILGQHLRLDEFFKPEKAMWNQALVTEINYRLEDYNVSCDLLIIITEGSIDRLLRRLDYLKH